MIAVVTIVIMEFYGFCDTCIGQNKKILRLSRTFLNEFFNIWPRLLLPKVLRASLNMVLIEIGIAIPPIFCIGIS